MSDEQDDPRALHPPPNRLPSLETMPMLCEIKHRWTGAVLFAKECASLKVCVEAAVEARANLSAADLRGADLNAANLSGADLRGADLRGAHGLDLATPEESEAMLAKIAEVVLSQPKRLNMAHWHGQSWDATHTPPEEEHSCGTAHCLAGWAQALCPVPLIRRMDPERAGIMLIPTAAHMFRKTDAEALEFLRTKLPKTAEVSK